MGEIEKINEGPPELPGEVLEQHQSLQGKSMLVKKLHSDLQGLFLISIFYFVLLLFCDCFCFVNVVVYFFG